MLMLIGDFSVDNEFLKITPFKAVFNKNQVTIPEKRKIALKRHF